VPAGGRRRDGNARQRTFELTLGCRLPPERKAPGLVRYRLAGKVIKHGGAIALAEQLLDADAEPGTLRGIRPSGPHAHDLIEFFDAVDGKLTDEQRAAPKIILNDQELRRMLAKRAKTLQRSGQLLLVHRPRYGPVPAAGRHAGCRPAADRDVRLRPMPASHTPPPPPTRVGTGSAELDGVPRQPRPRTEDRSARRDNCPPTTRSCTPTNPMFTVCNSAATRSGRGLGC
jgi:hypothetical protein